MSAYEAEPSNGRDEHELAFNANVALPEAQERFRRAEAEVERLLRALRSIAGKPNPSGAFCKDVALAALDRRPEWLRQSIEDGERHDAR